MKRQMLVLAIVIVVVAAGCGSGRGRNPGLGDATLSDCAMTTTTEGRLNGAEPVFVGDGQVLAIQINTYDQGWYKTDLYTYAFIDARIEVTNARIGEDADGNATTVGGFPPYSKDPGTFYQFYNSKYAELVTIEVPTGASYKFYSSRSAGGLLGTCQAPQ